jgi:hypothetical protein
LKYLDVFESPVRSLRFDVCLSPRQNGAIQCEIIGQWNEYEPPKKQIRTLPRCQMHPWSFRISKV